MRKRPKNRPLPADQRNALLGFYELGAVSQATAKRQGVFASANACNRLFSRGLLAKADGGASPLFWVTAEGVEAAQDAQRRERGSEAA